MSDLKDALENEKDAQEVSELQAALRRALAANQKLKAKREEVALLVREAAHDAVRAVGPPKPVPAPKADKRTKGAEVALWHLTDWQGSKVTISYNQEVMWERVMRFCDKAERLTEIQRADHPVNDAVLLFGGDLIEGLFNYPTQPYEIEASLFDQYVFSARLVSEVIRRALRVYRSVTVITEWGNHGRIGGKRAAVPRADNADRMVCELAKAWLTDMDGGLHERLTWQGSDDDHQRINIGNYHALLVHGDEFGRNGSVARTTFVKNVNDWKAGALPGEFLDCYVGHYHVHEEAVLADGRGAVYFTGSPESDNRYARDNLAKGGGCSQRLHFVEPSAGRVTAQYRVQLTD